MYGILIDTWYDKTDCLSGVKQWCQTNTYQLPIGRVALVNLHHFLNREDLFNFEWCCRCFS